jgi:hypothetical protein
MCMFPQEFDRSDFPIKKKVYHKLLDIIEKILYRKSGVNIINSYSIITANSSYTKSWMKKYWKINDEDISLLYPHL